MLYIDQKYVGLISGKLERFKKKNDYLYNFRCPVCGDSAKNKVKARGYIYRKEGGLFVKCHNCDYGTNLGNLIKLLDAQLYKEYVFDSFGDKKRDRDIVTIPEPQKITKKENSDTSDVSDARLVDQLLDRLDTLPTDNEAVQFVRKRKIPKKYYKELYFVDDIQTMEQLIKRYKDRIVGHEPRLVIPYFNRQGQMTGVSCRDLRPNSDLRYMVMRIKKDSNLIYGVDRLDPAEHIYVVEGPLDSLFIPNCIAVGGLAMSHKLLGMLPMERSTLIFDNEPRNKDVMKSMKKSIDAGFKVFVWPNYIDEKDVNDLIVSGFDHAKLLPLINTHTYQGLSALNEFNRYRKT